MCWESCCERATWAPCINITTINRYEGCNRPLNLRFHTLHGFKSTIWFSHDIFLTEWAADKWLTDSPTPKTTTKLKEKTTSSAVFLCYFRLQKVDWTWMLLIKLTNSTRYDRADVTQLGISLSTTMYARLGKSAAVFSWYICRMIILQQMFFTSLKANTHPTACTNTHRSPHWIRLILRGYNVSTRVQLSLMSQYKDCCPLIERQQPRHLDAP